MKTLSFKNLPQVPSLPTPVSDLEGVVVELTADKHPYYCDGASWVDLSLGGTGGGGSISISDEGTVLTVGATSINFTGSGVTVTNVGDAVTVTVAGAGAGGTQQVYAQAAAPVVAGGVPYLWFQTGLGSDGKGMTLWVEDGQ